MDGYILENLCDDFLTILNNESRSKALKIVSVTAVIMIALINKLRRFNNYSTKLQAEKGQGHSVQ